MWSKFWLLRDFFHSLIFLKMVVQFQLMILGTIIIHDLLEAVLFPKTLSVEETILLFNVVLGCFYTGNEIIGPTSTK